MRKQNLNDLIEYKDKAFYPKVLINEPGYRMLLLSLRAGQAVPEHATPAPVTVYAIRGHVTFHEGPVSCELQAGEVVSINGARPHAIEAHEDSALLVLAAGGPHATTEEVAI
ncbi:MAG TPA: cupin domain-containing protein [Acidobacteriaceae bacterium]|nr:cupin domain-containing protein [Acidobacteriaceae bacterium]